MAEIHQTLETVYDGEHLRTLDGRRAQTPRLSIEPIDAWHRVVVVLSEIEATRWDLAWDTGESCSLVISDGRRATLQRAACGEGCRCDATLTFEDAGVIS